MKNIILSFIFLVFIGCQTTLKSNYKSNCILYGKPEYILYIEQNNEFKLISFMDDTIKGRWSFAKRKLILKSDSFVKSEEFNIETDSVLQNIKYTDFDGYEQYIIKNNKLFFISKKGVENKCFYY